MFVPKALRLLKLIHGEFMSMFDHGADELFCVIVNSEGQHSLWLADSVIPGGWSDAGMRGTKAQCLAFVKASWTDMTPKSLREHMRQRTAGGDKAA